MIIQTVIFDFDGTIADSYEMFEELLRKFAPLFTKAEVTTKEIASLRQLPIQAVLKKYRISPLKIWWHRKKIMEYVKQSVPKMKVIEGVKEMISELKRSGIRMYILTSNNKENVEQFLKLNGITEIEAIYSEKNLFGKAAGLRKIAGERKIDLHQPTYYVGDETRDIEAAHKAGMKAIAVTWGYNTAPVLKEYNPEVLVNKPSEISDALA